MPVTVAQRGSGSPWAIVQSRAAVPLARPIAAGYRIRRSVTAIDQQVAGRWTRGDVARVTLVVDADTDMTWVVLDDPVPAGATILGGGLGRDSRLLADEGEAEDGAWPAFVERGYSGYRAYYEYVPKGRTSVQYTVRFNSSGEFVLPDTRVEALYAPEVFGASPNVPIRVEARAGESP
jgi:uncharacterized protein YfaS (alpha-2-macroglobulin family)